MNREDFLMRLKAELSDIAREDIEQIEEYYQELIYDGMDQGYSEEEMLKKFGTPEDVAKQVRREYGGLVPYTSKAKDQEGFEASDMVHTILVDASNLRIQVRTVENGPIRVLFHPQEGCDKVTFSEKDGIFSFVHRTKGFLNLNWLNLILDYKLLILEVPRNFGGVLQLKTSNASIRAANLANLTKAEFNSINGKIKAQNIKAETFLMYTSNARLELSSLTGEKLEAITNNGSVHAKECHFPLSAVLQTKNGTVSCRNLISERITMQTCNGSVSGTIIGNVNDYNIQSSTMNGSNNLRDYQNSALEKQLYAKTINGQIHIEFVN